MFRISSGLIKNSESITLVLVLSSPCAKLPHYFPHAVVHVSFVTVSLARVWYFEIVSPVTGCTTGSQKCSILTEVRILSSSIFIWRDRKCLGILLQMFAANTVNTSCKIMQVFWNCGSGSYAHVYSINTGWGCVLSLIYANRVFRSILLCLPGTYTSLIIVVNFF